MSGVLFNLETLEVPLSRRTDPASSSMAAAHMAESGALSRQRLEVLQAIREHGPGTAREIAQRAGLDRYAVSRRAPELRKAGLVIEGPVRDCTAGGRASVEWRATNAP